jgi:DNA-binding transcriptional MerR regulator
MNVRILTLFDDEPIAPQPRVSNRRRAIKMEQAATPALKEEKEIPPTPQKQKTQRATKPKDKAIAASSEKSYYTIGETAEMFGVRTSHIRFWTTEFGIKVRTTRKGDRLYTPENIKLLQSINTLVKIQGYTIAGAKQKLKELKNIIVAEPQAVTVKDALLMLKENLISLLHQL